MRTFKVFFLLINLMISLVHADPKYERLLLGRWHHVALVRILDNQKPTHHPIKGESYLTFAADGTWKLESEVGPSSGTYKWVEPDKIETISTAHVYKNNIGIPEIRLIRVDETRLSLITARTKAQVDQLLDLDKRGKPGPNMESSISVFSRTAQ